MCRHSASKPSHMHDLTRPYSLTMTRDMLFIIPIAQIGKGQRKLPRTSPVLLTLLHSKAWSQLQHENTVSSFAQI